MNSFFERGDPDELLIDLETVYAVLADENNHNFMRTLPNDVVITKIIKSMIVEVPLSQYAHDKNALIDEVLHHNTNIELIGKIMWSRSCSIIIEESLLNSDEDIQISTKEWFLNTRALFLLTTRDPAFKNDLQLFLVYKSCLKCNCHSGQSL